MYDYLLGKMVDVTVKYGNVTSHRKGILRRGGCEYFNYAVSDFGFDAEEVIEIEEVS